MAFANPVVGGNQLIRDSIQSENYIPGVSGWAINRDGTAEFATGTFRGPVVIIDPSTGAVLASVNADGSAAFQSVNASDYFLNGVSLGDTLANIGKGVVGQFRSTASLPAPGLSGSFTATCWTTFTCDVTRLYRITASTTQWINDAGFNNQDLLSRVIVNQPGVTGGASNATVHFNRDACTSGESVALSVMFFMDPSSYADGPMTVALQLAGSSGDGWSNVTSTATPFTWTVEDMGPLPTYAGGSGAPSGLLQWTVQYTAQDSRSYDGSGNYIGAPDGDDNCYVSTFADRPYTNERFEILFPGSTIRSDLTGATIVSAKLWLYCFKAEESKGSLAFDISDDTSIPSSFQNNSVGENWAYDDVWPKPGWYGIDMLATSGGHTMLSEFLTLGGNAVVSTQPFPPGLAATAFRGYGYGSLLPYIEITYIGNAPSGGTGGYGTSGYGSEGYGI